MDIALLPDDPATLKAIILEHVNRIMDREAVIADHESVIANHEAVIVQMQERID